MNNDQETLISVVVVSFNSEEYIQETLDSIYNQTYRNIELIVSDDSSTDKTVGIVENWLETNSDRFVRSQLIIADENSGVTANCNRGFQICTGKYIKVIAADDILRNNCIYDLLVGIEEQNGDIAFCYEYVFTERNKDYIGTDREDELETRPAAIGIFSCSQLSMYKRTLKSNQFPAPTSFIKRSVYLELGGFDEEYMFMEDYPFWLKALKNGYNIVFVDTYGVYYRKTEKSASWRKNTIPNEYQIRFQECLRRFDRLVREPEMLRLGMPMTPIPQPDQKVNIMPNMKPWQKKIFYLDKYLWKNSFPKIIRLIIVLLSPGVLLFKISSRLWGGKKRDVNVFRTLRTITAKRVNSYVSTEKNVPFKFFLLRRLKKYAFKTAVPMLNDEESVKHWKEAYRDSNQLEKDYKNHNQKGKIRIVFAIHLLFAFSSVESIYIAAKMNPRIEPHLFLLPTRQPGMDNRWGYNEGMIEHMNSRGYEYILGFDNGKWRNILELKPDGVFFQTPYAFQRHPIYDFRYAKISPQIMYTPYGPWVMDKSVEDFIKSGLEPSFFNICWRVFMDKFSLDMTSFAAPQYTEKCVLSGSPKVDFYKGRQVRKRYCWKNPVSPDRPKVIWMPRWGIKDDRTSFPDYYQYFIQLIDNEILEFVLRPHPFLFKDLKRNNFFTEEEYHKVIQSFTAPSNSLIDYNCDYREGLMSCDFLVMDFSSIIYEYLPSGKPVIYTKKENTRLDSRLIEACYTVENQEQLEETINMLLDGKDPKKERRLEIVEELEYFPHDYATNGEFITDYIVNNI